MALPKDVRTHRFGRRRGSCRESGRSAPAVRSSIEHGVDKKARTVTEEVLRFVSFHAYLCHPTDKLATRLV